MPVGYGFKNTVLNKTGAGVVGTKGAGVRNTALARTGFGKVGADGFGVKEFTSFVPQIPILGMAPFVPEGWVWRDPQGWNP